jgi:hypothetical protein
MMRIDHGCRLRVDLEEIQKVFHVVQRLLKLTISQLLETYIKIIESVYLH